MNGVVVGSINMDLLVRVPAIPKPGETCLGEDLRRIPGGKGANQAVALSRLGVSTGFVGCVGDDAFGRFLLEDLNQDHVGTQHVMPGPGLPTGVALILLQECGENSIVVAPGANLSLSPDHLETCRPWMATCSVLLTQLEIPIETVERSAILARELGLLSVLDAGPARRIGRSTLSLFDVVSPNETETETITGIRPTEESHAREAATRLLDLGCKTVVLKMGDHGAYFAHAKDHGMVPAFPMQAVDTTAAGDAFTAALALKLAEKASLREAVLFANAAGACAASVLGARPSMPPLSRVQSLWTGGSER